MNNWINPKIKWLAYGLELFVLYIIQSTPNLLPSFLGVKPLLLVVAAISIAMFEGEGAGIWIGLSAGLLMDMSAGGVFGFNGLVLMLICYACGALVVYLMRNNIVSAMVLGISGLLILGLVRWFFFYVLWSDPKMWYYLYAFMLPQMIYTAAVMPIAFFFNRAIATHLTVED